MRMKLFQANGAEKIDEMEGHVNSWLRHAEQAAVTVTHTNTAMCTIGEPGDEQYQSAIITIWYEGAEI